MDRPDIDWERLDRYISGEGTPEDRESLRQWVESDPELQAVTEAMRTAQRLPDAVPPRWETQTSWRAVAERLGLLGAPEPARPVLRIARVERGRRWLALWVPAAAAAAVLAVLAADHWVSGQLARRSPPPRAATEAGREYVALRGQRVVVHLPDGTEASLAPETRLKLSPDYGRGRRAVRLEGKAYFVVTHDSTRPFSVQTDRIIARDLGTRFVVRAYPADSTPDVVVAEGTIALGRAQESDTIVLGAGDRGRLTPGGTIAHTRGVAVDQFLAWTTGRLVFRATPLGDVAVELGRWYDVDIRLANPSLGNEQVTASFKDEPASTAIRLVAAAAGLSVERDGTRYILRRTS